MGFKLFKTDGGTDAILYTLTGGGIKPIHGAYFSGNDEFGWIICSWTKEGKYLVDSRRSALDVHKALKDGSLSEV